MVLNNKYSDYTICYTDGSKSASMTGCSFSIDDTVKSYCLNKINSVFSTELIAILKCFESLKEHSSLRFLVVSDSKSALLALTNINFVNPLVSKIYTTWSQLVSSNKQITLMWCPSHCGIRGNERVDEAAKNPDTTSILKMITPEDLKPVIKSRLTTAWQNQWTNISTPNKLKSIKHTVNKWSTSNQKNRIQEIVLTRMRIGHTRITHNYLFTRTEPPTCQCGERTSVNHILTCPRHNHIRATLPYPPALHDNMDSVQALFQYLNILNIFHLI